MTNATQVVLKDANGALRSRIIASRDGLVTVSPVDDFIEGRAVKAVVGELGESDFVVRVVRNGNRRKVEVIAGIVPFCVELKLIEELGHIGDAGVDRDSCEAGASVQLSSGFRLVNVAA
jgi:hypothetical protein